MKKSFTLIELVFVIIVIGILATVAIPKFKDLKAQAKVRSILKTTFDGAKRAYEAGENLLYLENNNSFKLKDILQITAKGWKYNASYKEGAYSHPNEAGTSSYASIILTKENGRYVINFRVLCDKFENEKEREICHSYNDVYNVYSAQFKNDYVNSSNFKLEL